MLSEARTRMTIVLLCLVVLSGLLSLGALVWVVLRMWG